MAATLKPHSTHKRRRSQSIPPPNPLPELVDDANRNKRPKIEGSWRNLDLILSLQSKELPLQRKIDLAYDFVTADDSCGDRGQEPVSISRLVSFLGDWIQSQLTKDDKASGALGLSSSCLDFRCWVVLIFCLERSSLVVSPNLLRSIACLSRHASSFSLGEDDLKGYNQLFEQALECLKLVLSSNARAFYKAGVELWVSCSFEVISLVRRIFSDEESCYSASAEALLSLSGLLLEHFASFLRFHPNPKNIFRVFVDRLLEPLLELLVLLHLKRGTGSCGRAGFLVKSVEDVLSNGLFHPVHISGFSSLKSFSAKQEAREIKGINKSYHRHFFRQLEKIIREKKAAALGGFGYLLWLFISRVKARERTYLLSKADHSQSKGSEVSAEAQETSKPAFEVFMQLMEPLLLECNRFVEDFLIVEEVLEIRLIEAHCMLKSVKEILESFIQEKVYARLEDTAERTHFSFLKNICSIIFSISQKIYQLWLPATELDDARMKKILPSLATEVVVILRHFLQIEYKVVGDNLASLWLMLLSLLALYVSLDDAKSSSFLKFEIIKFACQLVDVYSELRQVSNPIFALCKALRLLAVSGDAVSAGHLVHPSSSLSSTICLKSVATLFGSQEFLLAITNAIRSIPEGQASGCIQQLMKDMTDLLEWLRLGSAWTDGEKLNESDYTTSKMPDLDFQAEITGRFISEIYAAFLHFLTITETNSIVIGNSVENLVKAIRPSMSTLVKNQSNSAGEFILFVTGRKLSDSERDESGTGLWTRPRCMAWVFVFFFRTYTSCKSLQRQSISLMPPELSRKAAKAMGNLYVVSCGMDWRKTPDLLDEGYFSWIVRPSIPLVDIIQALSEPFLTSNPGACAPFAYLLHVMAIQRLVELNRHIKHFEFLKYMDLQEVKKERGIVSHFRKSGKKRERQLKHSRKEAKDLTNFITAGLPSVSSAGKYTSAIGGKISEVEEALFVNQDQSDLFLCSLNEKSLPTAIWLLLCKNTDIWCIHATDKKLKKFLSLLLSYSLPQRGAAGFVKELLRHKPFPSWTVSMRSISFAFFSDSVLHEQTVLYEHFASRWGRVMKKSLCPIIVPHDGHSLPDCSSVSCSGSISLELCHWKQAEKQSSSWTRDVVRTCESLLSLLCCLVDLHVNARSFSSHATYVLNLEKLVLSYLQRYEDDCFQHDAYNLFRLFLSCRRTLRHFIVVHANNLVTGDHLAAFPLSDNLTMLWFFKSVSKLVKLPREIFGEKNSRRVEAMIFVLIDHTAYIFHAVTKRDMFTATPYLKPQKELLVHDGLDNADIHVQTDEHSDLSKSFNAWKHVQDMAELLNGRTGRLFISLKRCILPVGAGKHVSELNWSALSSTVACIQGFLWGFASTLDCVCKDPSGGSPQSQKLLPLSDSRLSNFIDVFENFVDLCLDIFLIDSKQAIEALDNLQNLPEVDCDVDEMSLDTDVDGTHETFLRDMKISLENPGPSEQGCNHSDTLTGQVTPEEKSSLHANCAANVLSATYSRDSSRMQHLKGPLIYNMHKCEPLAMVFALRQLFIASAAILKLRCMAYLPSSQTSQACCVNFKSSSVDILVAASLIVLQQMAETSGCLDPSQFIRLDGVLSYLEVLGNYFDILDPEFCKVAYSELIYAHLRAIGKCISLQGKAANLSSQEANSSTKILHSQRQSMDWDSIFLDHGGCSIDVLKSRLRMSFKMFIRKSLKLHLLTAIKALERALIGVHDGSNVVDKITTGNLHGGKVSSSVAAGIDCLDLVLDVVSGRKQVIKRNMSNLIAAVLNIVIHLQNPRIFDQEKEPVSSSEDASDPGTIVLMCVGILTKVAGGHSYKLDPWHVSHLVHMPAALFQNFHHFRASRTVDRQFAVNLYAACCRLLCTTIKHRKWETIQIIALVEDSANTLLNSLEFVDADLLDKKGYFFWEVEEAVKCASLFRRIFEEIRQQKDVYGIYSFHFLSTYISLYSGYGALRAGIKREVDEELRPGVYSLMDVCTPADLQELHTALNDAPCRNTLANLQRDYRLHFQYEGKI